MRKPYEFFAPQTWAAIREQYLAGASAKTLSTRYGPTVDAIRGRISREGWSKIGHAAALEGAPRKPNKKARPGAPEYPAPDDVIPHHTPHIPASLDTNREGVAPLHTAFSRPTGGRRRARRRR